MPFSAPPTYQPASPASFREAWWVLWRDCFRKRVPVVRQQDAVECGAACLAMVLGFFGRPRALAQCRTVCDPGRDGLTAGDLADAARAFGLSVEALVIHDARALTRHARHLPAILHWQGSHFVVVERVTHRRVVIIDPAMGRRRLRRSEFDRCCSGIALTFRPGADFAVRHQRESNRASTRASNYWGRFARELLSAPGARSLVVMLVVATLAVQLSGLVVPVATHLVVDRIIPEGRTAPLVWLAWAFTSIVLSQLLLRYARSRALIALQARVDARLTRQFLAHVLRLPCRLFQQCTPGDLLMRVNGLGVVRELITAHSLGVALDGLFVTGYLLLLAAWSPLFAGLSVAMSLMQVAILALTRPILRRVTERHLSAQAEAQGCLVDALRGIASVKVAAAEAYVLERWSARFAQQLVLSAHRQRLAATFDAVLTGLRLCATFACLWLGAHEVMAGRLTVGTMLALNALAASVLMPLGSLVGSLQQFQVAGAQLERIRDLLDTPVEQSPAPRPGRAILTGDLRVDRLAFRYQHRGPLVLEDVSFGAGVGDVVAVVGRSGSGKSTLARLLVGLHEPAAGRVLLDAWSLQALDYAQVRQQCGVVLQESVVFNLTIRENIAFGRPEITFEDVRRAAVLAGLHDEVMRMPMAYDTCVLEAGSGLSGGQRQRLLIARAVAHRPALLVLDEATSHLDAEAECGILARLRQLPCTQIVIAHRMAATRWADLVIVLDRGRLVEQGSPATLLAQRGLYATLVDEQRVGAPGLEG